MTRWLIRFIYAPLKGIGLPWLRFIYGRFLLVGHYVGFRCLFILALLNIAVDKLEFIEQIASRRREFLLNTIDELAAAHPQLTIIFITQRIEDILPTFNRGMILRQGDILAYGTRDEVLTEANLRRAFDLDIRLIQARNGRLWTVIE